MNLSQSEKILVFDTETTGLEDHDQIIQLAWGWLTDSGDLDGIRSFKCLPTISWKSDWHTEHNLSMEDLEGYPNLDYDMISTFIDDLSKADYILGYNVKFDVKKVASEFRRLGIDENLVKSKAQIDPLTLWTIAEPDKKLETAFRRWSGKDLEGAHDASVDITATANIMPGMLKDFGLQGMTMSEISSMCTDNNFVDTEGKMVWENGKVVINFGKHQGKSIFAMTWSNIQNEQWYARNYHTFQSKGYAMHSDVVKAFEIALMHRNDETAFTNSIAETFGRPSR